jgi:5-formyltetrahydrofolate cyclo-ligase
MVVPLTLFDRVIVKAITSKSAMRRIFRRKRDEFVAALSPQDLKIAFSAAPSPLKTIFAPGKTVAAYVGICSEADPFALLRAAHAAGCNTALPYVTSKVSPMQFLDWSPGEPLESGPFGLIQPLAATRATRPDIVLVPLVAFDRRLTRLGQGAGHYDRALSVIPEATTVGIAWSVQCADFIPADPWDIPLDYILTEKEWIIS